MKSYLNCKKIGTAIDRAKKMLIKRVEKKGIYENFGQREVREIADAFINISSYTDEENSKRDKLKSFDKWCMHYNG